MSESSPYPFIRAKYFRHDDNKAIHRVVIHRMEGSLKGESAENCAHWFKSGPYRIDKTTGDRKRVTSSCHYCVDNNSIVQCVREQDLAFHAPPSRGSIGIEHAGRAGNDDWETPYCQAMLKISARLCAEICHRHNIPIIWLSIEDLKAGRKGITSHANVSEAFGKSSHWDPGPHFPKDAYVEMVKEALENLLIDVKIS